MQVRLASLLAVVLLVPVSLAAQRQNRTIFVNAVDQAGAPALDLTAADFDVREGADKRTVNAASLSNGPMRIMLLLDTGSGMGPYQGVLKPTLTAFIDAIPQPHEIGIMVIGRQARLLIAPTIDRAKLKDTASKLSSDNGGVAFFDGLRDAEDRFQKKPGVKWPVYVMFVTDSNEVSGSIQNDEYSKLANDLIGRGTTVHTAYFQKAGPTMATQIAGNLAQTTGGAYEEVTAPQTFPEKFKKIADRILSDFDIMKTRYQVEYTSDAKYKGPVDAGVTRPGVKGTLTLKRSF